ncbi:MAG: SAM-dependent methyltransferase [Candidatus Promineifilaceae bacterium]
MRKVSIIGIGAGNPDYLTLQAIKAIGAAEVFFIPDKGEEKAALRAVREEMLARHAAAEHRLAAFVVPERRTVPTYAAGVAAWRGELRDTYRRLLEEELGEDGHGAFLVWGDPALYDGTIADPGGHPLERISIGDSIDCRNRARCRRCAPRIGCRSTARARRSPSPQRGGC